MDVGDFIIANDLIGVIVQMDNKHAFIRTYDNEKLIKVNKKNISVIANAYATSHLLYTRLVDSIRKGR